MISQGRDKETPVRSHGWSGQPPTDSTEAQRRILDATRARLTEAGATSTSEVAEALGVTRQTIYRYFPTTEDLLNAASLDAAADLQEQLVTHVIDHLAGSGDAAEAAVEVIAFVYEYLHDDPVLARLLAPGRISTTTAALTAPSSIALGGKLLAGFGIDWTDIGFAEDDQLQLVEHLLRILQSLVLDPGEPPRTGEELRAYLRRWVAPALRV
jgi:AcrR family transcriptional regulator